MFVATQASRLTIIPICAGISAVQARALHIRCPSCIATRNKAPPDRLGSGCRSTSSPKGECLEKPAALDNRSPHCAPFVPETTRRFKIVLVPPPCATQILVQDLHELGPLLIVPGSILAGCWSKSDGRVRATLVRFCRQLCATPGKSGSNARHV